MNSQFEKPVMSEHISLTVSGSVIKVRFSMDIGIYLFSANGVRRPSFTERGYLPLFTTELHRKMSCGKSFAMQKCKFDELSKKKGRNEPPYGPVSHIKCKRTCRRRSLHPQSSSPAFLRRSSKAKSETLLCRRSGWSSDGSLAY